MLGKKKTKPEEADAETKQPQLTEAEKKAQQYEARVQRLREQFKHASGGNYCRTLKFQPEDAITLGEQWMKAVENKHTKLWTVFEVTETPDPENPDQPDIDNNPTYENIPFIDAIEKLSDFEALLPALKSKAVEKSRDDMGYEHFRAFAIREGIAFDKMGKPHPTDNRRIVTKGKFLGAMEEELQRRMGDIDEDALWPGIDVGKFVNPDKAQDALDQYFDVKAKIEDYDKIPTYVNAMRAIAYDYYGKKYDGNVYRVSELSNIFQLSEEDIALMAVDGDEIHGASKCFYNMKKWVLAKVESYEEPGFYTKVKEHLDKLTIYFEVLKAKAGTRVLLQYPNYQISAYTKEAEEETEFEILANNRKSENEKLKDQALERIDTLGAEMDLSRDRIQALKGIVYSDDVEVLVPEDFNRFLQYLEEQKTGLGKGLVDSYKQLVRPPEVVTGSVKKPAAKKKRAVPKKDGGPRP